MADNIAITPGTGVTIATDDIGAGVQVQRVKLTAGADGTAADLLTRTGEADSAPLLRVSVTPQAAADVVLNSTHTTAQTYATGDVIGGERTITGAWLAEVASPMLLSITAADGSGIGPDLDVILSASGMGGAVDGAAWAPDLASHTGPCSFIVAHIAAADWVAAGADKIVTKAVNLRIPGAYGTYYVNVIARSSYVMAANGDFRLAVVTDYS
jgi:hypothetical protein